MELRQLAYFLAVVDEGGFTRGADRLRVAQPAVSQQIRRLERELGEALFHRGARAVALTAAGEALLPHARATLAAAERAKAAVRALSRLLSGTLTIGLVQAQPDARIAELVGDYHRQHPHVRIVAREAEPDALLAGIVSGQLDVAFVGMAATPPPGIAVVPIVTEPLVLAVNHDHPLSTRTSVALTDLEPHGLATLVPGSGLRTVLDRECARAGFQPAIVAETTDLGLLTDLVCRGVGAAVMPAGALTGHDALVGIPIVPMIERQIAMAWSSSAPPSPAGRAFLALAGHTA